MEPEHPARPRARRRHASSRERVHQLHQGRASHPHPPAPALISRVRLGCVIASAPTPRTRFSPTPSPVSPERLSPSGPGRPEMVDRADPLTEGERVSDRLRDEDLPGPNGVEEWGSASEMGGDRRRRGCTRSHACAACRSARRRSIPRPLRRANRSLARSCSRWPPFTRTARGPSAQDRVGGSPHPVAVLDVEARQGGGLGEVGRHERCRRQDQPEERPEGIVGEQRVTVLRYEDRIDDEVRETCLRDRLGHRLDDGRGARACPSSPRRRRCPRLRRGSVRRRSRGESSSTLDTPTVFCTVTAVIAVMPRTPRALNVFRSAWIPAPPPESEPAIVRARGRESVRAHVARQLPEMIPTCDRPFGHRKGFPFRPQRRQRALHR